MILSAEELAKVMTSMEMEIEKLIERRVAATLKLAEQKAQEIMDEHLTDYKHEEVPANE